MQSVRGRSSPGGRAVLVSDPPRLRFDRAFESGEPPPACSRRTVDDRVRESRLERAVRSPSRSQHSTARSRHPLAHSRLGVARRDSMAFERLEAGGSRVESTVVQGDSRRSADRMGSPSACGPNSATVYGPIAVCRPPESELGAPGIGTGRSSRAFARDWSRVIRVRSAVSAGRHAVRGFGSRASRNVRSELSQ